MDFGEARKRAHLYLERSNDAMRPFDQRLRSRFSDGELAALWDMQAEMMRDYILSLLCHVYAGLLKDPQYAMGYLEEVIEKEMDDFSGSFEHRAPYREEPGAP